MLKKIKKYKITLHPAFILRNLKKELNIESIPDSMEKTVTDEINRTQSLIAPSATYNTYSMNETPEPLKPLWQNSPQKALSISLMATTIGPLLEKEMNDCFKKNETTQSAILNSIAREALEQSLHFLVKLLSEEAKLEGCELSPPVPIESALFGNVLSLLEAHKADILLQENKLHPLFSNVSFCFWNPISKNKSAKTR